MAWQGLTGRARAAASLRRSLVTAEEVCALKECTSTIGEEYWIFKGQKYHSLEHAGAAAVQPQKKRKPRKVKHSKQWRVARRRFERETRHVNWNPPEKKPIPPVVHQEFETTVLEAPWAKVKYDKTTYLATEVAILTRVGQDDPLTLMMSGIRNVRMYLDDSGGILIRPVGSSTKPALPAGGQAALTAGSEAKESSVAPRERKSRNVAVTLGGAHGLNPAKEGSKRYFLVEAMLEGGSVKEIFKSAAIMFHQATGKPRTEFGMVATPSNMKLMFEWLIEKLKSAGKEVEIKERDGKYRIKV